MPWAEAEPMTERMRFVADAERDLYSMTELCTRYGISRRTGYKWLDRYDVSGPAGLLEGSRAPHRCPHRMDAGTAAAIVAARRQHPSWGPRKLLAWLDERRPDVAWPAASTAGDLLRRRGLVQPRRRRGVDEQAGEGLLEHVVDRLPVDARALHRHVRHALRFQPLAQTQELGGRRPEGLHVLLTVPAPPQHTHTRRYGVPMAVQSRAPLELPFNDAPPPTNLTVARRSFLVHDSARRARTQQCGVPKAPTSD